MGSSDSVSKMQRYDFKETHLPLCNYSKKTIKQSPDVVNQQASSAWRLGQKSYVKTKSAESVFYFETSRNVQYIASIWSIIVQSMQRNKAVIAKLFQYALTPNVSMHFSLCQMIFSLKHEVDFTLKLD